MHRAAAATIDTDLINDICAVAAAFNLGKSQNKLFSHDLPRKY